MNKKIKNTNKKLTKEEKLQLLKDYLVDEIYVKAITDTLSEKELDNWIDVNLDCMLLKVRGQNEKIYY